MEAVRAALEIALLFVGFYAVLRFMQGTRGEGIMKGYAVLFVVIFISLLFITQKLELRRIAYLLTNFLAISFFALIIIFQPELRNGLIRLGQNPFLTRLFTTRPSFVDEILRAVERLAKNKVGALVAIEREIGLGTYVERGVPIDAEVTRQLITTIFWPGSPLHDGAIVIRHGRVAAAGCLFPLTENPDVAKSLGTRHRAAIGLTDETDALVVAVSEEDGTISLADRSQLHAGLEIAELARRLEQGLAGPVQKALA